MFLRELKIMKKTKMTFRKNAIYNIFIIYAGLSPPPSPPCPLLSPGWGQKTPKVSPGWGRVGTVVGTLSKPVFIGVSEVLSPVPS